MLLMILIYIHLEQPLVMDDLPAAVAVVVHKAALLLDADVVGVHVVTLLELVVSGSGGRGVWQGVGMGQELRLGVLYFLLDLGHPCRHLYCHGNRRSSHFLSVTIGVLDITGCGILHWTLQS